MRDLDQERRDIEREQIARRTATEREILRHATLRVWGPLAWNAWSLKLGASVAAIAAAQGVGD